MKNLIVLTLLFSLAAIANTKPIVVAKVNEIDITKKELELEYLQAKRYGVEPNISKRKILDSLIHRALGIQLAKKENLQKNPIVEKKMNDVLYHAKISKDLEKDFQKIKVTDSEVKSYYKTYPEYRTAHILLRLPFNATDEEVKVAKTKIDELSTKLKKNPALFPELANKYSQGNMAPNGGDIGYQPAMRMAKKYFDAIKGKPNEFITEPVRTAFGYHIIKVLDVKKVEDIQVEMYKKIIYDQKRDRIINQYFSNLKKDANIRINTKEL